MSAKNGGKAAEWQERGFSFIELIVGLAIMMMIATVVTPVLAGAADRARVDAAKQILQGLGAGIRAFEADVKEDPGYLHQLVHEISGSETNACGLPYRDGNGKGEGEREENGKGGAATWAGPYIDRDLPSNGTLPVGIGTADDALVREGSRSRSGSLSVLVREVTPEDAAALDQAVDGGDGAAGGTVRWSAAGAYVTLLYSLPAPRC